MTCTKAVWISSDGAVMCRGPKSSTTFPTSHQKKTAATATASNKFTTQLQLLKPILSLIRSNILHDPPAPNSACFQSIFKLTRRRVLQHPLPLCPPPTVQPLD